MLFNFVILDCSLGIAEEKEIFKRFDDFVNSVEKFNTFSISTLSFFITLNRCWQFGSRQDIYNLSMGKFGPNSS